MKGKFISPTIRSSVVFFLVGLMTAFGWITPASAAGLFWSERRIPMDAPYAQSVVGNQEIYVIASTSSGLPSFAWSPDGWIWHQSAVEVDRSTPYEFISGAAEANGVWLAVGPGGLVYRSTDTARSWQRLPPALNRAANFRGVAAIGGNFVAYGTEVREAEEGFMDQTGLFISRDAGSSWESIVIEGVDALQCAAGFSTQWIAAGEKGLILRSTDSGVSWNVVSTPWQTTFTSAAAGNGVMLLVGALGQVIRSIDGGATWLEVFPAGDQWIQGVVFGDGRFVLSGGRGHLPGSWSADGLVWNAPQVLGAWGTLGHGPGGFLAVGGTYGYQSSRFSPPELLAASSPSRLNGTFGRAFSHRLRANSPGVTFAAAGLPPGLILDGQTGWIRGIPSQGGLFPVFLYAVDGASAGSVRTTLFAIQEPGFSSAPAIVWREQPTGLQEFEVAAIQANGDRFVAVGETWNGAPRIVWSDGGNNWQPAVLPAGVPNSGAWGFFRSVTTTPGRWIVGGGSAFLLQSTDDGRSWNWFTAPTTERFSLEALQGANSSVVAVGKLARSEGGEGAGIFVSVNAGASWQDISPVHLPALRTVAFADGVWIAGGERGILLRSENPLVGWEAVESGTMQTIRVLSGYGPYFLAWAEGGRMFRSADAGKTWVQGFGGSDYWPGGIAVAQGVFALSGGGTSAGAASREGESWQLPRGLASYGVIAAGSGGLVALNGVQSWLARVNWPPVILPGSGLPLGKVGEMISFGLQAEAISPVRWSASGLPRGLLIDPTTGVISGVPRQGGIFNIRLTARNATGASRPQILQLEVRNDFPSVAGTYHAIIPAGGFLTAAAGGALQLQVTPVGTFTGRLTVGIRSIPIRGELDAAGNGSVTITNLDPSPMELSLSLTMTGVQAGMLRGELEHNGGSVAFAGSRNIWNPRTNPASNWEGTTHILFYPPDSNPLPDAGIGFARVSIGSNGNFRLAGRTADNQPVSFSGVLSPRGSLPVHAIQARGRRCLNGSMDIQAGIHGNPIEAEIDWGPWEEVGGNVVSLTVLGARYEPPGRGSMLWNLPELANNAQFSAAGEGIESGVTIFLNGRAQADPSIPFLSISLNVRNGQWSGSLRGKDGRNQRFQGLILSSPWNRAGAFTLQQGSHAVLLSPANRMNLPAD